MRTSLFTAAAALLLVPSLALAQPAATPAMAPLPAAPAADAPREVSPVLALGLSLGVTAAGYGAIAIGADENPALTLGGLAAITLGPSTGHWYAGQVFSRGMAVRAAGMATTVLGLSQFSWCDEDCDNDIAATLIVVGATAVAVGTVDDIVTAPLEASKRNRRNRALHDLTVAPRVTGKDAGLVVAGRF